MVLRGWRRRGFPVRPVFFGRGRRAGRRGSVRFVSSWFFSTTGWRHRSISCRVEVAVRESQRDSVAKPTVARHELPWVISGRKSQPQRGCGGGERRRAGPQPRWGWVLGRGVPKVARPSQPWADGHNPFGIESGGHCSKNGVAPRRQGGGRKQSAPVQQQRQQGQ